jgi:hypothetical protein
MINDIQTAVLAAEPFNHLLTKIANGIWNNIPKKAQ